MKICENELKIIDKLKIKKKNSVANVPKKWFSTQNGPLDVRFQMRLTQTFFSLEESNKTLAKSFKVL